MAILAYAYYSKPFKLHTDACNLGLDTVLYQKDEDGLDRVIMYASRTLSKIWKKLSGLQIGVSSFEMGYNWPISWISVQKPFWCIYWQ